MKNIFQYIFIVVLSLKCFFCAAQPAEVAGEKTSVAAGLRMNKAIGFYWSGGISAEFSSVKLLRKKITLGTNFISSVIGNGIRPNAIKTYQLDVSLIKYFREDRKWMPLARLNLGYMYAAYGKEYANKIQNQSPLCSLEFASAFNINKKIIPVAGFGYQLISGNGKRGLATVFPLYAQVSLFYKF